MPYGFGYPQISGQDIRQLLDPQTWQGFLDFFRKPPEGTEYTGDRLTDMVESSTRRALEANPLADPGPAPYERPMHLTPQGVPGDLIDEITRAIMESPPPSPGVEVRRTKAGEGPGLFGYTIDRGEPAREKFPSGRSLTTEEAERALEFQPRANTIPTDPSSLKFGEADPMRARAQERISAREASEQEEIARAAAHEAEKQRLLEAAGIKNQQREFMAGTVPLVEDYDKGIAIGGMPGRGGRDEILARIRAQALAKGGGTVGAGGGTFSQATMTPEIEQRLSDRDAWTAEQPMRDAAFALSPEQIRRNPEGAAGAEYLRRIGQDQMETVRREKASKLLQQFIGPSGKIQADDARKLAAMDPIFAQLIPADAIGLSREQAAEMIDAELMSAQQIAQASVGNFEDMLAPMRVEYVNRVYPLAEAAKKRLAMGEDPELVWQELRGKLTAINFELMQSPIFQQSLAARQTVPAAAGE